MSRFILYAAKPGDRLETTCRDWREVRAQVRQFKPTTWRVRRAPDPPGPRICRAWITRAWAAAVRALARVGR